MVVKTFLRRSTLLKRSVSRRSLGYQSTQHVIVGDHPAGEIVKKRVFFTLNELIVLRHKNSRRPIFEELFLGMTDNLCSFVVELEPRSRESLGCQWLGRQVELSLRYEVPQPASFPNTQVPVRYISGTSVAISAQQAYKLSWHSDRIDICCSSGAASVSFLEIQPCLIKSFLKSRYVESSLRLLTVAVSQLRQEVPKVGRQTGIYLTWVPICKMLLFQHHHNGAESLTNRAPFALEGQRCDVGCSRRWPIIMGSHYRIQNLPSSEDPTTFGLGGPRASMQAEYMIPIQRAAWESQLLPTASI
ncbi:hypothetical protein F4824DRAFT_471337 [Ustulina deusta]|nr:hypothetical protein F4824DRAFT_471337 [Ustulina deusta]